MSRHPFAASASPSTPGTPHTLSNANNQTFSTPLDPTTFSKFPDPASIPTRNEHMKQPSGSSSAAYHMREDSEQQEEAVHFVLLAEFDIDQGSTLAHQYPYPTGTDEHRLAELMLPDGAHLRGEDWTIFYLGQDQQLAVDPMFSHESLADNQMANKRASMYAPGLRPKRGAVGGGLLYVLTCVRCKEDKTVKRGALVKGLAICTPMPWIHVFKPILLLALEEYFRNPSAEILAHLYDTCNSGQILVMPNLTRAEKILMRQNERRDLFEDRYEAASSRAREIETELIMLSGEVPDMVRKGSQSSVSMSGSGKGKMRDTHYFDVDVRFRRINVPMKIPLSTFDEEVGDYSLVELISTFSKDHQPFPAPFHPYLHTNGASTHPIILLINAMLAHKRVLVLGTQFPANHVARIVLAICALATGCGQVLRGFTETALPYCNLSCYEMLESMTGFVAGITNPRFVDLPIWDVCCDLESGKITVNKNLKAGVGSVMATKEAEDSSSSIGSGGRVEEDVNTATVSTPTTSRINAVQKADCVDNQFMEEINSAIASHYGEMYVRQRMTDYILRFTRLAAYQEYLHHSTTKIGYISIPFRTDILGSGTVFQDDQRKQREMWANGNRIDAWRKTKSYKLFTKDWHYHDIRRKIPFDIQHQIARLRTGQNMSDQEAELIFRSFALYIESYEQVIELLIHLPPHWGGLAPIANGMFHRWPAIRDMTVDILLCLQQHHIGKQAISSMNYYYRRALIQAVEKRNQEIAEAAMNTPRFDLGERNLDGSHTGPDGLRYRSDGVLISS